MKIKKNIIVDFLKKTRIGELEKVLLQFNEEGLVVSAADAAEIRMVNSLLKKESFIEYTPIGNVGVDELSTIISIFKNMDDDVEFVVEGNLLTAKSKKKTVAIELVEEKFIQNTVGKKELEPSTIFEIDIKDLHSFIADIKVNDDTRIEFNTVDEGLILNNRKTDKYRFEYNINAKGAKKGYCSKFGNPLVKGIEGMKEGTVKIGMGTDFPIIVTDEREEYNITLIVAPQVENA